MAEPALSRDLASALVEAARRHLDEDFAAAETGYRAILEREPAATEVAHLLAMLLLQKATRAQGEAMELAHAALAREPDNAKHHFCLGTAYAALSMPDQAINAYRRAIALDPDLGDAYTSLGAEFIRAGQYDEAVALYDDAFRQRPDLNLERTANFETHQSAAVRRGIPGILLNTMPKSASIFIWNRLREGLTLPHCRVSLSLFPRDRAIPSWVAVLAKGGAVSQAHLDASAANLAVLEEAGLTKLVVHVRDPRQATLSWVHHLQTFVGERAPLRARVDPPLPADYDGWSFADRLDWNIENHLPEVAAWVEGWLDASRERGGRFEVLFTRYEDFLDDEAGFYRHLLAFYGIEPSSLGAGGTDLEDPAVHFRSGRADEWREVFSPAQRKAARRHLPDTLCARFAWGS